MHSYIILKVAKVIKNKARMLWVEYLAYVSDFNEARSDRL